ncbi:MAG: tRNA epoxyqueuosine(34) reductase QueG [Anaerolineaceae bacterium]|nr:tRNA epoxyqueuosine(34) reductase QueG [Anaerolineaceae bacterium]
MDSLRQQTELIKARAKSLGFSIVGITNAEPLQHHDRYMEWINKKHHAGMNYLTSKYHIETRRDPHLFLPSVKSIIIVGFPYPLHPTDLLTASPVGLIGSYTTGEDYHSRLPRLLDEFMQTLRSDFKHEITYRICTDSAPILERELACRAGLGWIGKNSFLISPRIGSTFLIAEILLDTELEIDHPDSKDRCGKCDRCIQACPTGCIHPDRTIDANRCISYHTIENRGEVPPEIMQEFGNWIFGCDICQMVCPWNKKFSARTDQTNNDLVVSTEQMTEMLSMSEEIFQHQFGKTALSRTKRNGLLRNLLIRLGNLADPGNIPIIHKIIESTSDPTLLYTAHWAINQISK